MALKKKKAKGTVQRAIGDASKEISDRASKSVGDRMRQKMDKFKKRGK